ncbi:hypothetical protein E2C01_035581 [Portunus trituberculatus]|uniref:Uncharacterized protein n=1 Tax=Portunus trituberculatus TaxID=210409 RepID=A0A5B7F3J0_PORTR|nr:hypothetical protein [Portunus trituberculatus]
MKKMEGERRLCNTLAYVVLFTVGQFAPDRPPLTYVMLSADMRQFLEIYEAGDIKQHFSQRDMCSVRAPFVLD